MCQSKVQLLIKYTDTANRFIMFGNTLKGKQCTKNSTCNTVQTEDYTNVTSMSPMLCKFVSFSSSSYTCKIGQYYV